MSEHPAPGGFEASRALVPSRARPSRPRIPARRSRARPSRPHVPFRRAVLVATLALALPAAGVVTAAAWAADGDDGPAIAAQLNFPRGLAVDPTDGDLLIADTNNHRVRRVTPGGTLLAFAGGGGPTPALNTSFSAPEGVVVAADGVTYVADTLNNRVWKVGTDGSIAPFAGSGAAGFTGDGGPATLADMSAPRGLAIDPRDGDLLIADVGSRVRRVDVDTGVITTAVGTGAETFSGDGGPAAAAAIHRPTGLAFAPDGTLFVADTDNDRVRRVAPDGTITTVAGTGIPTDPLGDGGPATGAGLDDPRGVAVASDGALLITDTGHDRVRRVDPVSGTITTVAGTGAAGFAGDGGPATAAAFDEPTSIVAAPGGALLVADSRNRRVRRFVVGGPITTVAGGESAPAPPAPGPGSPTGPDPGPPADPIFPPPVVVGPTPPPPAPPTDATIATAVTGKVTARRPGAQSFRPLAPDALVASGTEIDTTRGTLKLAVRIPGRSGFRADLDGGRFVLTRGGRRSGYLTDLRLTGPACRPAAPKNDRRAPTATGAYPRPAKRSTKRRAGVPLPTAGFPALGVASEEAPAVGPTTRRAAAKRRRNSRKLRLKRKGSGPVRTRTNDGAAVARGTVWTTTETCSGTTYRVSEGRIEVRDLARGTKRTIRRGASGTIRAARPR